MPYATMPLCWPVAVQLCRQQSTTSTCCNEPTMPLPHIPHLVPRRWLAYDFPEEVKANMRKVYGPNNTWDKYKGQAQKWFLLDFVGNDSEVRRPGFGFGIGAPRVLSCLITHVETALCSLVTSLLPAPMQTCPVPYYRLVRPSSRGNLSIQRVS